MKKIILLLIGIIFLSCAQGNVKQGKILSIENSSLTSGEIVEFSVDRKEINVTDISCLLKSSSLNDSIEKYNLLRKDNKFVINRFLNKQISPHQNYFFDCAINTSTEVYTQAINIDIQPSVVVESLCSTDGCESLSGNVINDVSNNLTVSTLKIMPVKFVYDIETPYESYQFVHEFNSPVSIDYLPNIVFKEVSSDLSSYIALIKISVFDMDNNSAETVLPVKVVRPVEVKHFGSHELAEVYEPVPVTGCIPGTVGSNVQYSESTSETRQNSVSITINNNWSNSFSSNESRVISEGISVGETQGTVNSSSMSNSETQSESFSETQSEGKSNNISFNTSEGENWSWSLDESSSSTEGQSQSQSTNTGVNGSTTVGASGEGSLPFLAKASGKIEVSAGVSRGWGESSGSSSSETNSESRGYSTGGSAQNGRSYGSVQNDSRSHSLSGAYVLSSSTSNSISESSSLSSGRVWNMSESLSSGKVVTEGSGESISQTIVNSSSSSTTFSYSGYIPRGRYGIFFRQTSRYIKLSEIITYDINGFASHAGFIMMNSWAWAPELSVATSCEEAMQSTLPLPECLIPPCGE